MRGISDVFARSNWVPEAFHARFPVSVKAKNPLYQDPSTGEQLPGVLPGSWRDWVGQNCAADVDR